MQNPRRADIGTLQAIFVAVIFSGIVTTPIAYLSGAFKTFVVLFAVTGLAALSFAVWRHLSRKARAEYRAHREAQMSPEQVRRSRRARVTALAVLALYLVGVAIFIAALA